MDSRHGGLAQDDLHPPDVGPHLFRHLKGTRIGISTGEGPYARHPVPKGDTGIFKDHRYDLHQFIPGKLHVARQLRLHLLAVDVQAQVVMYLTDDLLKGILPQAGINTGPDCQNKIAQALGGKPGP